MLPRSGPPRVHDHDFLHLVPRTGAWTARWGDDGDVELYCDVTTPPITHHGVTTAIDLDLDVVRRHDGQITLIDQDQFADRSVTMHYPPEIIALAQRTAGWLYAAVAGGREPFATAGAYLLAHPRSVSGPAENIAPG